MSVFRRFGLLIYVALLPIGAAADSKLPAWLIRVPDSVPAVFVAEASKATFHRYDQEDGVLTYAASYYMSVGQNGWGKERRGDLRTPIGTYIVTEQLNTERMHEKYGVTAYVLDYPNTWDRRKQRTGDGIWVHGVDPRGGRRPPLDTDGCIALPNEDLDALAGQFSNGETPVVIAENIERLPADELQSLAAELENAVDSWAQSIADGDLHTYLSHYHPGFERWGMNRDEWASFSVQTMGERPISDVTISDLLLLGYPGEQGLYLSRFRQVVTEGEVTRETMQRVYWRRDERGALKIIAEDNG